MSEEIKEILDKYLEGLISYPFQRKDKTYILDYITNLQEEIERLNNIINECMESVCCIEHNLEKYEEIGLDHFHYALNKTIELKEYLYEELKEGNK